MNWIQINENLLRRFRPETPYLVGVSGGRDSVVLLHWLVAIGYKNLIVCHLNHQLRGKSSEVDARFVAKLAATYDVDLAIASANVAAVARRKKLSVETAAREERYRFFAQVAKRRRCRTIFLAHHADDLVETFLINLFRGAGMTGLSSMRELSRRPINNVDLTIVRPFLGVWRTEIDKFVRKDRLKFREDASNENLTALRNRIRGRVIRYLEKAVDRNICQSIWRAAMIAAEEERWIDTQLADAADPNLSVEELRKLPVALQRRQILKWLRAQKITNTGFDVVERLRGLLDHDTRVSKINLPQDRHARRRAGKIFIE